MAKPGTSPRDEAIPGVEASHRIDQRRQPLQHPERHRFFTPPSSAEREGHVTRSHRRRDAMPPAP